MAVIVLLARLVLVAVFGVAGLSKLMDRSGSRQMMVDFGAPGPLAGPAATLLPLAELAVAVALLPLASAWWGALGALVLLLLFVAAIAVNLARGRRPDCHCFGQIASGAIGGGTLVRNALLALVAAIVLWQGRGTGGVSAVAWIGDLSAVERVWLALGAIAVALIALEAGVLLQLMGQNGRVLLELQALQERLGVEPGHAAHTGPAAGLPVGVAAPDFSLADLDGQTRTLANVRGEAMPALAGPQLAGRPSLLVFSDPDCGPCSELLPDLARWQRELVKTLAVALVSRGAPEENRAKTAEHGLGNVLLQLDRELMGAYLAVGTPSAVLVMADGTIGSHLAQGAEEIRALVARLAAGQAPVPLPLAAYPPSAQAGVPCPNCGQVHGQQQAEPLVPEGLVTGSPAPALKLPDLEGREVDLADFRGRETLVLFWSPSCGFCQQMLPALKQWEQKRPKKAPALLLVSNGTPDANAGQGLSSTIVLDQLFAAGQAFRVTGTPSGVLVDSAGKIATPLAVGAPSVMALASGRAT